MRRRDFIGAVGGAAAVAVRRAGRSRTHACSVLRVGLLTTAAEGDPILKANLAALFEGPFAKLGWMEGGSLRIELRFTAGRSRHEFERQRPNWRGPRAGRDRDRRHQFWRRALMQQESVAVPIVFCRGAGPPWPSVSCKTVARPEGNTTGFRQFRTFNRRQMA